MDKIKIVDVKPKPRWKFWTSDNLEVTLEDERGNKKTITVFNAQPIFTPLILKQCIIEKYYTGDQFWSLHQAQEKALQKVMALVGETFDPAEAAEINEISKMTPETKRRVAEKLGKIIEEELAEGSESEEVN